MGYGMSIPPYRKFNCSLLPVFTLVHYKWNFLTPLICNLLLTPLKSSGCRYGHSVAVFNVVQLGSGTMSASRDLSRVWSVLGRGSVDHLTSYSTMRLLARSALFPAKAITMLGLACRCSSFTHVFARAKVS